MSKQLLILGSGGHSKVLIDILKQGDFTVRGIVSKDLDLQQECFRGYKHFEDDKSILDFQTDQILLVNGIGSLPFQTKRFELYDTYSKFGYEFATVISHEAQVSPYVRLGRGVQIMAGAIVQAGTVIGDNTIINTGAIIDHDCSIGNHNHIAPGAVLSGGVITGTYVHIGTNASVIQSLQLGDKVVAGAGSTVTKNLKSGHILYPAKNYLSAIKR